MKLLSIAGFGAILLAVVGLWEIDALLSASLLVMVVQISAALLMIWARVTFGRRSFHVGANPTAGGLITTGPYRIIRHPIYAAICIFVWAGALANLSTESVSLGLLATAGAIVRVLCEERLVMQRYPEYRAYSLTTKRLLPGIW